MSKIIDISRTLSPNVAVWPGDSPFSITRELNIAEGEPVNLTRLRMSAHTATHVDSTLHFFDDGIPLEQTSLLPFWGLAQVVTIEKPSGPLHVEDIAHVDLSLAPRLLLHTVASDTPDTVFVQEFVYPSPEFAAHLAANGIILYGIDAPSVDAVDSEVLTGHYSLGKHNIAILEGACFKDVPDGIYDFVALPLKIAGGDGSPVRAALRTLD